MVSRRILAAKAAEHERWVEKALVDLRALGADHAEVSVGEGDELEVNVRGGEVELLKEARSSAMSVRVIVDGKVATSSTSDLRADAITRFLQRTVEMAQIGEEDPYALPPDPKRLIHRWDDLDLFDPRTARISPEKAIAWATQAEAAAFRADRRVTASERTGVSRVVGQSSFGTSGGFLGSSAGTYHHIYVTAIADDAEGKKRSGSYWTGGRFRDQAESAAAVGREAARRAVRSLGARKMPSGVYPVVFDRDAARQIIGLFAGCVLGDAVYRKRSYLADRLGQTVANAKVTLVDDPTIPRASGSRAYDGEGCRPRRHVVVKKGNLETFLLDTYSSRKLGLEPTGSAAGGGGLPHASTSNFFLAAGRTTPEGLLAKVRHGLYVTRMMGFGFDPVTGNFSRGAEGFVIENGELTTPVSEVTISRNLDELMRGIDAIGNDLDHKTAIASPSFRVDAMTVGGA